MKSINHTNSGISIILFAVAVNFLFMSYSTPQKNITDKNGFAVIELFTSEGCSSCPPADAVAAKLLEQNKANVFIVCFHVDYWNYLGWKDIYSNTDYSKRQSLYGQAFHLNSIYTPQVIINGETEMIGSAENKIRNAVTRELGNSTNTGIELHAANHENKTVLISYKVDKFPGNVLNIALVQLHAQSDIKRGENKGSFLHHVNVVRNFKTVNLDKNTEGAISLSLPKGLSSKDCKVIAYTQHTDDYKITGAIEVSIE